MRRPIDFIPSAPQRITCQSSGDFETVCDAEELSVGDVAEVFFRAWDEPAPPYRVRVHEPNGKVILAQVLRKLPTGCSYGPPPVRFEAGEAGSYRIEIAQLYGGQRGSALLEVA